MAGAVTEIPGKVLQAICLPGGTFGIVADKPTTVIGFMIGCTTPGPSVVETVLTATIFFALPQPATAKPRTANSASARTAFTQLVIRRLRGHSGTLAQASAGWLKAA